MSNVQVAIRVRPLSTRETADGARIAVQVEDKIVRIKNMKLDGRPDVHGDSREKVMEFGFDYCYWSVDPEGPNHASQEEVFQDLGVSVLTGASEGYNVCLFAYGQTGSGKTYTMIGTPASVGLTPRICQGLFNTDGSFPEGQSSCRVEISFLEIYNERVRDLLRHSKQKKPTPLRVREHPEKGPYVQGLSQYVVSDYKQAVELLEMGIANRITAATHMHDASSRSHAIFSIQYTQAILDSNLPSEIVSKISLVDLAGSERADPNYCRDRITEGSNINKSLVTLGIVISALAQNSQMFSSCQSINSMASEGETSVVGSQSSSYSGGTRRQCFIPYRDSVLTWLLKDSLGGNSKTIMIATVSPSCSSYSETLSTLRYAAHARNIVNKPRVNEDANVKLIRELREEIDRLKSMLLSYKMLRGPSPSLSEDRDGSLSDIVLQNEIKVEQLTKDWSDHWRDKKELLEQYSVDINRDQAGFLIHSLLPHLIALDRDVLSTGVTFYHLREGVTKIGPQDQQEESQIVLQGEARCEIVNHCGLVTLRPLPGSVCTVNGREVTEPCRLAQGAVITLGDVYKFRFNHPAEAAILRERRRVSQGVLSHSSSVLSSWMPLQSTEEGGTLERGEDGRGAVHRQRVEEQQRYVECLREEMQAEQRQAEQDLQREQAHLRQQQTDIQQWLLQEKQHLSANEIQTEESEVQTDQVFNDLDGGLTDTVMGHRKRVVQEELLRHHALRRAEYRVRRKRLHYQLERIARKRHLLEAKRVLQCLESALSPESSMSSEPDSPVKTTGSPDFLRRHSFSADLLSCLYPKHNPTFSHLLRRNKSLELSSSLWRSAGAQKWVSDDCLPLKRIRNRANTLPSRPSFKTQANPSETVKADLLGTDQANMAVSKRKLSFTKRNSVISKNEERQQTDSSDLDRNEKARLTVHKLSTPYSPPSVSKLSSKGSKGLERIRSVFSHSAGPGIRTALSKLFRKPPPGFVGNKDRKPVSTSQFQGNKKGNIRRDAKTKQSPVKINLEPISPFKQKEQRSWQSEEALSKAVGEPSLQERMDNGKAEEGEDFSDCDSSFSLDSLSSAYASALAEQLKREESELSDNGNDSEPESINSQISQDSLVLESNSKVNKMRSNSKQVMSSHCYTLVNEKTEEKELKSLSSLGICAFDDMPAEAFWNIKGVFTAEAGNKNEPKMESVSQPQLKIEAAALLLDSKEKDGPLLLANSSHQFSRSSAKASENLLVLTDAWACPEPSDSPRAHSDSTAVSRLTPIHPVYSSYFHSSVDLSESLSGPETRPFHIHNSKDSENATLLQHKYCDSETDNSQAVGQPGDHRIIASIDGVTDTSTEFVYSEGCDLQECSEIVSGIKREVEESVTLEKSIMQKTDPNQEHLCSAPINAPSLICESDHFPPKRESGTFKSMETFSAVGDRESILSQSSDSGFLCRNNCFTTEGNTFNIESARREEQQTQESDLVDGIIAAVCCQSDSMSICETDTSNCHEKLKPLSNEVDEEYSDESEIKCSDRKTYPAKGVDSEDTEVSVKEGKILKIYSLDAVPKIQGSQASLGTQRDFQLKDLQVLSENPREPLNFPSISGCSLNVNKCTGSLVKDFSLSTILCNNRLDVPQYLAATRQEYDCGKTTGYLVRTVGKGYKLSEMTQCLKQGIRQKVYSLKVCKTLTTYYRYKHFKKKKKCKLGSCYTTSKYRRKKRADKQAPIPGNNIQNNEMHDSFSKEGCEEASAYIYQEKFAREKISPQSQHNHISSSELCEFGSAIFQSNEYLADIRKMNSNVSAKQSGLKSCKTCISTKSIDASVAKDFNEEPVGNREIVVVSQTSDIQGGNADLLEYLGNTEEWDHSPVDQISEAVKEQTKLTQKGFENLSNGQLSSKMGTVELKTQKRESISVEQVPVTLKGVDKSFLLLDEKTNPINSDSLTSTVCKEITGQDVVLDDSQKNALTQVQQSSPDRKTDMPSVQSENRSAVNCGVPLPNTKKHECSPMVITGDIQTVSHSNKCPDSLKLSSTANILITDVLKSHQVKTQPETDRAQHEIPSRCATAKCQSMSLSMHKIDSTRTSQRLETVSKPETKQNPEVHDTHSSTCLLENCQKYDLSRQGHFSKPAAQTVGNNLRNICTSAAGSPIGQLEENERNVCLLHSEDTCKSCLKICQSFQNGPDNGDYLDVLAEPKKQVLPSEPSLSIHVHPLSASGKVSDANLNSVNLNENSSSNCTNMNGQIRANCKLNVLEKQSCGEDAPQSVSSECLCLAHCQSETIGKEMSSFGSRKPHNSCELLDFTETSKTEQIWETPNATKEDGLGSFQRLYLKSESSRDESQSSCTVSTNPSTCAFQMQEYAVHQTKDFLQSYPSLPNGSTQLTFLTDNNCCMEGHSDGKPLFINIHTVNHDSYQQDSDISGMPNLMNCSFEDIHPSDKTTTLSPNFKPKQKQLQDITVSHSLTKSLKNGKKLSRFNAREKSASSSECSVNLSSEEKVIAELCSGKSLITQSRPGSRIQSKLEVSAKTKKACTDLPKDQSADSFMVSLPLIQNYESLKTPGQSFDQISSTLCTETKNKGMNKRDGEKGYQADDYVPGNLEKNAHVFKTGRNINDVSHYTQKHPKQHNSCLLPQETVLDLQNFQNKDTAIHFASCDVNPFLHPRQEVATQRHYKVFGSATDISNKTPVLDGGSNRVTRWCSVDNELNVQSSPFYSHLHTFANKQTLSSTLSSTEGHKEQDSSEYTSNPHLKVHIGTSNSSASAMSEHLDSSSCQIDEMMLMCPSEQFSGPMHKEYSVLTCNPSTQATVPSKTKKRMNCNRRSRPEIHRTSMGAEGKAVATTLASLQNMSLHLSQLIHNTSDLLGNIDAIDRTHFAVNNKASSSSNCCKRDSSTQTAIDIAIQTDGITKPVGSKNIQKEQQTKEALKPHEVNVIVKVIGTDVLSISSEKEDIALTLQERISKRKTAQERHSLPDLHLSSDSQSSPTKVDLQKVQTSASSLDIFQRCSHLNPQGNPVSSSDHIPEQVSSTNFGDSTVNGSPLQTTRLKTQTLTKDLAFHQTVKGVFSTDRASSPILTLEAGVNQIIERKSSHAMGNCQMVGLPELMNDQIWKHRNSQSPTVCRLQEPIFSYEKSDISDGRVQYDDLPARSCANISNSSVSLENVRNLNGVHSKDNVLQNGFNTVDRVKGQTLSIGFSVSEHPSMHPVTQDSRLSHLPSYSKIHQTSPTISSNEDIFDCKQEKPKNKQMYFLEKELSFDNHTLGNYNREAGDTGMGLRKLECLDILDRTVQSQEDIVSLVASECNTDILINTKPLMDEAEKECVRVPEDLPMHNKFTNWSGVNCWPPSSLSSSLNQLPLKTPTRQEMKGSHSDLGCSESLKTDSRMLSDNRMKEIERLRQEREQLMATVRLDMNPHQLTVELAEAKLHYGLGETDALLKLLKSGSFEEACGVPTKQQLYDRHRRSIEGLRQEREVRLQTCRRTRSLSPGKLNPEKWPELPVKAIELPSQQREYLQKLRQELVTSSRVAAHPRKTGACPSEIELLLQDYGRAREVAKAEIARARDRLRERTEQEKRRLQQRALSQLVKDDLRLRTRVSSSTLCTGSSLSLSSGPTSGYSSSNPVLLKEGHRPSGQLQISKTSVDEEGKTRGPSPGKALLNVDSPRPWMPGQDAHVEAAVNRSNPQFPSSTASCRRRRTSSLTFVSPVSPSYQDIAASTLACATAEIHSAGNGDLKNLLAGKASHGWRYQGRERGVQTFYKSSSSPSMHSFLGAVELQRPLPSLWCMIRDHSKAHLYNGSIHSTWTRPLDSSTELVYLLTDASGCHLTQPRDFCCISAESKQDVEWVLAVRSVCDKSFPPPSREAVRGELSPSAWLLQPSQREGREVVVVFYLLQVDLGAPALPRRLLSIVAKKQAAVIAELDAFFSL